MVHSKRVLPHYPLEPSRQSVSQWRDGGAVGSGRAMPPILGPAEALYLFTTLLRSGSGRFDEGISVAPTDTFHIAEARSVARQIPVVFTWSAGEVPFAREGKTRNPETRRTSIAPECRNL